MKEPAALDVDARLRAASEAVELRRQDVSGEGDLRAGVLEGGDECPERPLRLGELRNDVAQDVPGLDRLRARLSEWP